MSHFITCLGQVSDILFVLNEYYTFFLNINPKLFVLSERAKNIFDRITGSFIIDQYVIDDLYRGYFRWVATLKWKHNMWITYWVIAGRVTLPCSCVLYCKQSVSLDEPLWIVSHKMFFFFKYNYIVFSYYHDIIILFILYIFL